MAQYRVEMTGEVREVYLVEADSEQDAMNRWMDGECLVQETLGAEPVSARLEDD